MQLFIFLSEILGRDVIDKNGCVVGRLCDIPLRMSDEVYPRMAGLMIQRGVLAKEYAHINVEDIQELNEVFKLKITLRQIEFKKSRMKFDLTLCHDILDRQVVDTDNQKVVRVNDVHLLRVDNNLYLAHVDVGTRALVRRLEWSPLVDWVVKMISPRSPYLTQEEFIPWRNTQVLTSGRYKNVLRLDVARKKLSQIPPIELAEIMEDLDKFEKLSLFQIFRIRRVKKLRRGNPVRHKTFFSHPLVERDTERQSVRPDKRNPVHFHNNRGFRLPVPPGHPLTNVKNEINPKILNLLLKIPDIADSFNLMPAPDQGIFDTVDRLRLVQIRVRVRRVPRFKLPVRLQIIRQSDFHSSSPSVS